MTAYTHTLKPWNLEILLSPLPFANFSDHYLIMLPISYLEAMGMGCVIVGTATEGIAEVVTSEENGILVQPGDYDTIAAQVCACIENPAKAESIAQAGRKTAQNMTWNHNAQKLLALFQELITR